MRKGTTLPGSLTLAAAVTVAVLGLAGTAGAASPLPSLQPPGWDADIKLAEAPDRNPDPKIVEIDLDARVATIQVAGQSLEAWTYNGGIPGPLIRARVGDRLIVHFSNHLPMATTVHWHGVRVPIEMDGVPEYSQPAVEPGQTFTYDFILSDPALFWYHPHVMSAAQVGFGLYGALLVEDPDDGVNIADQLVLVLSDISIDDAGKLESPESGGPAGMVFGREGNHTLINGRTSANLNAANGAPQRWRVVNTSKSRHFQLDLEGLTFTQIGADGGLQEYPVQRNRIVLAAGERTDVIVQPRPSPGPELVLRHIPYNRGYGSVEYRDVEDLVTVKVAGPAYAGPPPPRVTRVIEPIPQAGATAVNLAFTLAQLPDGSFEYGIDGSKFNKGRSFRAAVGETQIWTVANKTKWSHPFHLHGFFFQVLDEKSQPVRPLAWKDTVNIPLETTMKLIVTFDDRPGRWMVHCHILDHAEGGLMTSVLVGPGDEMAPEHHHHPEPRSSSGPGR